MKLKYLELSNIIVHIHTCGCAESLNEIEYLNKWKEMLCLWFERLNIALSMELHRLRAIPTKVPACSLQKLEDRCQNSHEK